MNRSALASAAAISLMLLAACSKPAATDAATDASAATQAATTDAATATTSAADGATAGATTPGGAVSPPAENAAVDTTATTEAPPEAASNSFTEGQAKGHIEKAGYSNVTGLTKTADGMWTAKAVKAGKTVDVALDFKGAVTAR